MDPHPPFLDPGRIGTVELKNRLVRAPTSESMANVDGAVNDALKRLYGDLAHGGAGLIITGHIYVEPRGQYTPHQMGIHDEALVAGLAELVDVVLRTISVPAPSAAVLAAGRAVASLAAWTRS